MTQVADSPSVFLRIAREKRLFEEAELEGLLSEHENGNPYPERAAIAKGVLSTEEYLKTLENYFFNPAVDIRHIDPDPAALLAVPEKVAAKARALPLYKKDDVLTVAMAEPDDLSAVDLLKVAAKCRVQIRVSPEGDLVEAIERYYGEIKKDLRPAPPPTPKKEVRVSTLEASEEQKPLVPEISSFATGDGAAAKISDQILKNSLRLGATDVHLEPGRKHLVIRFRIDGVLQLADRLHADFIPSVISRFKVISGMDIAEKRIPQDGRYSCQFGDQIVDCRVSSLPSRWGEKIVVRLLRKDISVLDINEIQMPPPLLEKWKELMKLPLGMVLVTGPTGSGKTTTLYATIANLDRYTANIITLEDPIEYEMGGITQVQINHKAGLTFTAGLRSILRQDPDTVLVGEIRDKETVEIACRAALTGHKIYSTLHTNDAPSAVTRLLDMGVPPYLLTASLKAVLAQRLLRTLCQSCAEPYEPQKPELARLGYPKIDRLMKAMGCPECNQTGYRGRQAVFELLVVDETFHRLITDRASAYTLKQHAIDSGMMALGSVTRSLVISGKTSMAEAERVVFSEEIQEQLCPNCHHVVNLDFAVCPFCQFVLKESCPGCGSPVDLDWEACPSCGTELEHRTRTTVCSSCLATLDGAWTSCPYCGAAQG